MKENKLIIFDWGGVIASHEHDKHYTYVDIWNESISQFLGVETRDFYGSIDCFIGNGACISLDTFNSEELDCFFIGLLKEFSGKDIITSLDVELFKRILISNSLKRKSYNEVKQIFYKLRGKCYLGILSNCSQFDILEQTLEVPPYLLDFSWRSCEIGFAKPSQGIYDKVVEDIKPFGFDDILFIDDFDKNLIIPKELGWKTYLAQKHTNDYKNITYVINKFLDNGSI